MIRRKEEFYFENITVEDLARALRQVEDSVFCPSNPFTEEEMGEISKEFPQIRKK